MENSPKWAVIFIGPPGSGKDTQADMLGAELGLHSIQTSLIIEHKIKSADPSDSVLAHEKELYDAGQLNTRELVEQWVIEEIRRIAATGQGITMQGSPRRVEEAAVEMPVLEELFDRDHIKIVYVNISEETSVERNAKRKVCELNHHPIPPLKEYDGITVCPKDGSPIITRGLDDPEIIKKRYKIYLTETQPVLDFLTQKGYNVLTIDGERSVEEVHRDILNKLW